MARPVLIDCDPGVDDAVALFTALASPDEIELRAITTVAGNITVDKCTRNARILCDLAGRTDVPVHAGADRPLLLEPVYAGHVHGQSGIDGVEQFDPATPAAAGHGVQTIIEQAKAAGPDGLTLVAIGPLTNLALAFRQAPEILPNIRELVIMGGARREGGNITANAEFNMRADPHAAAVVFACGRPITLIGLDATMQVRCTPPRMDSLAAIGNKAADAAHAMLTKVNAVYVDLYGATGAALHDPCTIGWLLAPELYRRHACNVQVETSSALTMGHTAVDLHHRAGLPANVEWVTTINADGLFELLFERLGRL